MLAQFIQCNLLIPLRQDKVSHHLHIAHCWYLDLVVSNAAVDGVVALLNNETLGATAGGSLIDCDRGYRAQRNTRIIHTLCFDRNYVSLCVDRQTVRVCVIKGAHGSSKNTAGSGRMSAQPFARACNTERQKLQMVKPCLE